MDNLVIEAAQKKAEELYDAIVKCSSLSEKISFLSQLPHVEELFRKFPKLVSYFPENSLDRYLFYLIIALHQFSLLFLEGEVLCTDKNIKTIIEKFRQVELFYDSIGGVLGYYSTVLRLFCTERSSCLDAVYAPQYIDCKSTSEHIEEACYESIVNLSKFAEVYVAGGSGERLKLVHPESGEIQPVASLVFAGRAMLHTLFRDLQAREYLYFRLFGEQVSVPVVIMTSEEKNNHLEIVRLLEKDSYYQKGKIFVSYICQPLVPVVTVQGNFARNNASQLIAKPGGHGVLWKLLVESGLLERFLQKNIPNLLIRQVNNPLSSLDHTLSSFYGMALLKEASFGFIGCPPRVGFAEGMLVSHTPDGKTIANIEYTEFDRLKKNLDHSRCPANTNILFARIEAVLEAIKDVSIPGLMVNAKTECEVVEDGVFQMRKVARLESMMQSLSEHIQKKKNDCFVALYERAKALSVTKKAFDPAHPFETPEAALHDFLESCKILFCNHCKWILPPSQSLEEFLKHGPNCIIHFHPALGPFWSIIEQKIIGGKADPYSEIELEIAELFMKDVDLSGSFRILAKEPLGTWNKENGISYSKDVSRAYISRVSIRNKGFLHHSIQDHLRKTSLREEECTIILEGKSEVFIEDVTIQGSFFLTVPDGKRAIISQGRRGKVDVFMENRSLPGFEYIFSWKRKEAPKLSLQIIKKSPSK